MPRKGEAQDAEHPWRKRMNAQVRRALDKKQGRDQVTQERPRATFVCVSCGDESCVAGECVSDF